jgi:hypothetical protein
MNDQLAYAGFPLLAHVPPKHHRQSSGDNRPEHAHPHRNNHAIQGDFPTSKKAKNVRDGNEPEETAAIKVNGFIFSLSFLKPLPSSREAAMRSSGPSTSKSDSAR